MPVFQSALTAPTSPRVPLHWLQSSSQPCHTRTRSNKGRRGKKRNSLCSWRRCVSASCFTIGKKSFLKVCFWSCKKHEPPSVSGLASKMELLLRCWISFCMIIYLQWCLFSNWPFKVERLFEQKHNFYGVLKKCWKYYNSSYCWKCTYLVIIFVFINDYPLFLNLS